MGGKPDWPDWLKGQITVPIDRILSVKNAQAWVSMDFTLDEYSAPRTIKKIKILGAVLEVPPKYHCQFGQYGLFLR